MPSKDEDIVSILQRQADEQREREKEDKLILLREEQEKAERRNLKRRYMQPDLTFDQMFKQSCARVYYIEKNAHKLVGIPQLFALARPARKLLSRFQYNKKNNEVQEKLLASAIRVNDEALIEEYRAEADKYLIKCLHAHYGIGVMYGQFLGGMRMMGLDEDDV